LRRNVAGTVLRHFDWVIGRWDEQEAKMGQSVQPSLRSWKAGNGERLWLAMLIDTMEQVSRPELRAKPCDGVTLAALRAQLALPASVRFTSPFSLRN